MADEWTIRLERDVSPAPALAAGLAAARSRLATLAVSPPQVILLEGGRPKQREATGLWWAARLNCQHSEPPCLDCPACRQIFCGTHQDLYFLEAGRMNIVMDQVREVLGVIGEAPRGEGFRVIVIADAHLLNAHSANALLKSLEEPRPGTIFVLLTPQRERILPTLVSRSLSITLPWPPALRQADPDLEPYLADLTGFVQTGQGWFGRSQPKGAAGKDLAMRLTLQLQRELLAALKGPANASQLSELLAGQQDLSSLRQVDIMLDDCREALELGVNPALALDCLAVGMRMRLAG